ncbi:hypothetical protein PROSTU_03972 [Providencia stuartii ATCC 25827]|uniref:Uncharacterized protein n=1 Tax=Providencia stuartii ATCC 25827 TaxID=471874 RepID=A0AA86YGB5_PROST|nr:hypothetical protein PROSTU_03972 [Providencia stuartii ATCC 25827]
MGVFLYSMGLAIKAITKDNKYCSNNMLLRFIFRVTLDYPKIIHLYINRLKYSRALENIY